MKRSSKFILGIVVLLAIVAEPYLSYKLLPVVNGYQENTSWPNDGIDMVIPLSIGPKIGKAPNGDPILDIPGQPNHDWVYREQYPHWWTGAAWVTSKKGINGPNIKNLTVSEIRIVGNGDPRYDKLPVLDKTNNTRVIQGFMKPMQEQHFVTASQGGKSIGVELISPNIPGLILYTVVVVFPGKNDYVYTATTSPNKPNPAIKMDSAFSNWLNQVQQAHSSSFIP
ncbi:hypothetical protein NZD89_29095 (plasmid) [Alicyclobacillus fastidiosus]|uniref:Uncharacterized protein n=1 Tax=Alicyclobacillus fastidiosus TaxID=392011 RepID=A0ABY6ZQ51_9BACL|nr:hypothetical protein [Alicyclobacillus fastidiosus]WAH44972.1 hypothetical protein NZD89_29095 [Alicyclobacillus fastidiosus]GMA66209.1 hypothetical protein GCM10025859_66510 [Alicyclobacillus fastidiosus]GMA66244.1 hypothetical protein GCM10025859_66860 [Alicyclobacillus fastidiosus]